MTDSLQGIKKIKLGKVERYSFARKPSCLENIDLIELPKKSYKKFLDEGIGECLRDFSPIKDYSGKAYIYFLDYKLEDKPKIDKYECRRRGLTYSVALRAKVRLVLTDTGEAREQEVFLGDIPYMTEDGSFISDGVERVIVNQIVRSPSLYFSSTIDKTGKELFNALLIPTRGMWFELEQSNADTLKAVIDRGSKISVVAFLKCFGYTNEEILDMFNHNHLIVAGVEKEDLKTQEECLIELAKRMRPNDMPDANATRMFLDDVFFNRQRYSLESVGRYKLNKKLYMATRIEKQISAKDIKLSDQVLVKAGEVISSEMADKIANNGINVVDIITPNGEPLRVIGNNHVYPHKYIGCDIEELNFHHMVYFPALVEILEDCTTTQEKIDAINENLEKLIAYELVMEDFIGTISYHLGLDMGVGTTDTVDNLENKRVAPAGELLQNAFRIGVNKLSNLVRETMQSQDMETLMPSNVMNARPINKELRGFLATNQLSQLMDQVNPIAGLTQKRKLSSIGKGGIKKERAGTEVRDIHDSQYGRICAIETPEGQSIGLINSLACFAKIDEHGFILAPYRKVNKQTHQVTDEIVYLSAEEEKRYYIAQSIIKTDKDNVITEEKVLCRYGNKIMEVNIDKIDFTDYAPTMTLSTATALVPFIENNESARALMASNMQRQAVPLITTEAPIVGTGMEYRVAIDSGVMVIAKRDGVVSYVDALEIRVKTDDGEDIYKLVKFNKPNNETCFNQKPIVSVGDAIKAGDVLADGYSTKDGELALGKNMLVAFMNFDGYNYEDAVVVSERISKEDIFTSINLREETIKCRSTKLGDEEITRDIPGVGESALKNLDERGIVRVGAEVKAGDILVGKVTPKGETELTPEERLLRQIFGEKARDVKDKSLRVDNGQGGIVVDVQVFSRKNKDELESGVNMEVKVCVAQKRKLTVGDKMSGRYGNKGVVSRIVAEEDMPFMPNGRPVDILLNPLSVNSRMNLGQLLDTHLGLVAKSLGWKVCSPCFDGASGEQIQQLLKDNNFPEDGKMVLYDGRTGLPFENRVTVGYQYMLKLDHMVDSKMHARSTGPYALVTSQPLGGKALGGGQKFGEMEVWALYAYGAAHILQELLTIKSDDEAGRVKTFAAIVNDEPLPEPGIPESFKVLLKELQALALDITILNPEGKEISIAQLSGDVDDGSNALDKPKEEVIVDIGNINFETENQEEPSDDALAFEFDEDSMFDLDE